MKDKKIFEDFERRELVWRSGKTSQIVFSPFRVLFASILGRISNLFFSGNLIFPMKAKMFFGEAMVVPVPLCADMWKFGAFLLTDPEIRLTKFFLRSVKDHEVFFDVGAHIGYYSNLIATLSRNSKVYAFEPDPHTLVYLRKNAKNNITIIEKAVSGENSVVPFFSRPLSSSWISTLILDNFEGTKNEDAPFDEIKVEATTLDLIRESEGILPTIIKIDVEGAEELVLEGGEEILKQNHLVVCVEIRFRPFSENYRHVIEIMEKNGFSMFSILESGSLQQIEYHCLSAYFLSLEERYDRMGDVSDFDNVVFIK